MRSEELFSEAKNYLVGGVNSPVRAYMAVSGTPIFIQKAKGSKIFDVDGKEYIDYVCSYGPLILGHLDDDVVLALKKTLEKGTSFGAPTFEEIEMAKLIVSAFPSIDLVRMTNSGTEAVMSAIRLARGYTKRNKIIKFEGCYHGHADSLLVEAGSGLLTFGTPKSAGVPKDLARDTLVLPYNNSEIFCEAMSKFGYEIACVVVEPVAGNMGVVLPKDGFLKTLREETEKYGSILIFDEVITGFRLDFGGAQTIFNINPDITCLGKIIGGGLPVGAFGGRRDIMERLSPLGDVYQAGTLSGNPLAVSAGIATLKKLKDKNIYKELDKNCSYLCGEIMSIAKDRGVPLTVNRFGSMWSVFFKEGEVKDLSDVKSSDADMYIKFFWNMIKSGIYFAPSPYESAFLSYAHTKSDLQKTVYAFYDFLKRI